MIFLGNEELLECKQKQIKEDRIMEERIKKFIQYRREREAKVKLTENTKKNARENGILQIVKAQEVYILSYFEIKVNLL